jgi:hypothetical protein
MIAWRLDRRLAPRVDPSDVVQDVLVEADRKLNQFLQDRPFLRPVWQPLFCVSSRRKTKRLGVRESFGC